MNIAYVYEQIKLINYSQELRYMIHTNNIKKITSCSLLAFMALGYWTAKTEKSIASGQTDVTAELMLSIDVSGSVNSDEYNLQMDGYAAAFRDSEVISTIESLPEGLAVGVQFWATLPAPPEPWQVLKTEQDSIDFANYLDNLARPGRNTSSFYGWYNHSYYNQIQSGTNVSGAIAAATESITTNQYNGDVLVIDVSGDGKANGYQFNANNSYDGYCDGGNTCQGVKNARDAAVSLGITINGLPIENSSGSTTITDYYDAHVKGGIKGFVETAAGFSDFTRAAKDKIYQEVSAALNPKAQDDIITTDEKTVATYNLIAGDPNNANAGQDTDPNGDTITVTKYSINNEEKTVGQQIEMPSGALLTVASNGDVTYDPNGKFDNFTEGDTLSSPDMFTYVVSDSSGYTDGATATLNINGVADDPVAKDVIAGTDEETPIPSINVLKDVTDPDSDEFTVTQIDGIDVSSGSVITLTSGAEVTLNSDGTLKYNPKTSESIKRLNLGENKVEIVDFTVSDELGNTDIATLTVTVEGITNTFAD